MIVGKDVCKSFEGFKALDNASFHVRKGSVYGLVGPNGAGKSTLIRHITGVFEPDSGSINVAGENVTTSLGELFSAAKSAVRILVILAG